MSASATLRNARPQPGFADLAEQALSRTTGAPIVSGNALRILKDCSENYPAWLLAIQRAQRSILFENYIVGDDDIGHEFAAALAERAREGVQVRVIYDWLGSLRGRRVFAPLAQAGGEVRSFNPPRLDSPFGWLTRDHRKSIAVDGEVAFVTGLCAAKRWAGDPARNIEPWRDTGVELRGPAVAQVEQAFAQVWNAIGEPLPEDVFTPPDTIPPAGDVDVIVVATEPTQTALYRLDHFVATVARKRLWLTDAYFIGTPAYVQALRSAATDAVDVRLLVPGSNDLPIVGAFTRAGYRPLLEAGVRVFEWNGSMLHAKTAVCDGRWSRVGSSNLNVSSWLGNYELDVAVYDERFGKQMEEMYRKDLEHATEITLGKRFRVRSVGARVRSHRPIALKAARGSASRAAASALRISNTVTAALTNRRILGRAESGTMWKAGLALIALAVVCMVWPWLIVIPFGLVIAWIGLALVIRAFRLRRVVPDEDERMETTAQEPDDSDDVPEEVVESEKEKL